MLGFHLSELPETLQDAVFVARHMGLRYLWIDSLCICQDDSEEWARESARMINVYSGAHIVIAANHANNNSAGCFHIRNSRPEATITLARFSGNDEIESTLRALLLLPGDEYGWRASEFRYEPLSGRGWALQERVLAKRVLHYNTDKMYFECNHGIVGEDGYRTEHRLSSLRESKGSQLKGADHATWNQLLWMYGDRKFTKATDKLPAMSGLAELFEQRLGAKYIAGLWSDDLIEGLAWQGLGKKEAFSASDRAYVGPSWSWANYEGIAASSGREGGLIDVAEIKEWNVEPKTDSNPYGEVKTAWIRIRAPMTKLTPSPLESNNHEARLARAGLQPLPRMCTRYSDDENGSIVTLDHRESIKSGEWRQWELELLMLGGYPKKCKEGPENEQSAHEKEKGLSHCYCLVVQKVDNGMSVERRKRVGWMFLDENEAAKLRESESNWVTVTLV
jgi:hypothetical protein